MNINLELFLCFFLLNFVEYKTQNYPTLHPHPPKKGKKEKKTEGNPDKVTY